MGNRFFISPATLAAFVAKRTEARIAEAALTIRKIRTPVVPRRAKKPEGIAAELADVIIRVLDYCAYAGIDIENVLEVKHEYNKSRPYRHGGKKC